MITCLNKRNSFQITVVTLRKHAEKYPNVKGIVESIAAKLESAGKFPVFLKYLHKSLKLQIL